MADQKIVLVTGASSGLGKHIAEDLAKQGYHVFAAARSMDKLATLRSETIEPLRLDVTAEADIQAAVDHIKATKGRLDILVNNAGYGIYGTIEGIRDEHVRRAFAVNVFGLGAMTRAVLPMMREQKSGLIINISSVVGKAAVPVAGWYGASKHAVEGLSDALRLEVKPFGIKVVLIEPGAIRTGFEETAMATLARSNDPSAYADLVSAFSNSIRNGYKSAPGPEVVTRQVNRAIAARNPKARYIAGSDSRLVITLKRLLGDGLWDRVVASQYS